MAVIGMVAPDLSRAASSSAASSTTPVSPYECGLGWSVDFAKGDFQGRDGLERDRDATTLRLTSVVLDAGGDEASGARLSVDGQEVGFVTQAVVSPHLGGKTLGLAKIRKELREPGVKVTADVAGDAVPVRSCATPSTTPSANASRSRRRSSLGRPAADDAARQAETRDGHAHDGHQVDLPEQRLDDGDGSTQVAARDEVAVADGGLRDVAEVEEVRSCPSAPPRKTTRCPGH